MVLLPGTANYFGWSLFRTRHEKNKNKMNKDHFFLLCWQSVFFFVLIGREIENFQVYNNIPFDSCTKAKYKDISLNLLWKYFSLRNLVWKQASLAQLSPTFKKTVLKDIVLIRPDTPLHSRFGTSAIGTFELGFGPPPTYKNFGHIDKNFGWITHYLTF